MAISQAPQVNGAGSTRERFIAFAFCWADVLLELDETRRIVYAGGITKLVTGLDPEGLTGRLFDRLVVPGDGALARQVMEAARRGSRFEAITLRFLSTGGVPWPMLVTGYQNPELDNRFFIALRFRSVPMAEREVTRVGQEKLLDSNSFADVAKKLMTDNTAGADRMTLVAMPDLSDVSSGLDDAQREEMLGQLGNVLKLNSANGDAAAKMGDGKYGVVHEASLDVDALKEQIKEVVRSGGVDCDGLSIDTATLDADSEDAISEDNLTRGIIYAINKFGQSKKDGVTLEGLSSSIEDLAKEAVETAEVFNRVVKHSDFFLALHPIVEVNDGEIHHYEALARFTGKHGESPYKYITFAEETGLIGAFDLSVVDKATEILADFGDRPVSIAVNISGQSIVDLRYVEGLQERLTANPWLQGKMIFELTESSRVDDLDGADRFIQTLRGMGYPVCLDDFGAGAASFQYLSAMDVDVVKLDGSAVKNAQANERGRAFMTALTTFCKQMQVETIAEMIDSPESLAFVRDCGVDFAQGYLFGEPSADVDSFAGTEAKVKAA